MKTSQFFFRNYRFLRKNFTIFTENSMATEGNFSTHDKTKNHVYAIINNIPQAYHSSDLRNYFSQFVETKGFECFHFRHRPEKQSSSTNDVERSCTTSNNVSAPKTFCCVVKLKEDRLCEAIKMYHRKHWLDRKGESIPMLCYISKVKVFQHENLDKTASSGSSSQNYLTRAEQKLIPEDRESLSHSDLLKLPELHPPDVMPNGNVGTPTLVFLDFIKQCRLPPILIKKLGLTFPKTRSNKKYGNVPFHYGGPVSTVVNDEEIDVKTGQGHVIKPFDECGISTDNMTKESEDETNVQCSAAQDDSAGANKNWRKDKETKRRMKLNIEEKMVQSEDKDSGEDEDSCEEWERHEALYDDVSNQERNTERLFEEEIELKWEKGGSGLVFYTDAQYWQQQEGDFDEQTADDWDVDMSAYYEEGAGDKDAKDYITMRQEKRRRDGTEDTDRFTAGIAKKHHKMTWQSKSGTREPVIGQFEKHTKGIGRKILTKQGWTDGEGLGSSISGISDALEGEGQTPKDKTGLGYRGEKLTWNISHQKHKKRAAKDVIISTVYDNPADTDPTERLLRRNEPYSITYRHPVHFKKAEPDTPE